MRMARYVTRGGAGQRRATHDPVSRSTSDARGDEVGEARIRSRFRRAPCSTIGARSRSRRSRKASRGSTRSPFERTAASGRSKRALIVDYDQVAAADGALHPRCKEALQRYAAEGWAIALTAWWPDADDAVGKEASSRRAGRVARELALEIDLEYCRHGAGPPVCWCRKPLPGLDVVLIERHGLDPSESLLVASGPADRTFAARLGFSVVDANELF